MIMSCNICLGEDGTIISTCDCTHQAHLECIRLWHSNVSYGKIIHRGHLCCPQCKSPSKYNSLSISNKDILDELNRNPG